MFIPSAIRNFIIMPQKNIEPPPTKRLAKLTKTTQSNTATDRFDETSSTVRPEWDRPMRVVSISDVLKTLLLNNDDNHNCNHMNNKKGCKLT